MNHAWQGFRKCRLILRSCLLAGMTILVSSLASTQTVSVFDTVYTPPGDGGGAWVGTMFVPARSNGIGIVVVHGSGVNRTTNRPWCDALAANGYVVLTIDYPTIGSGQKYPKGTRAVKLAVEFLRRNAALFKITTGRIVGLGFSDGAMTIGEAIPWDNDDAYFQTDPGVDDHFDAAVLLYGEYGYRPGDFLTYFSGDSSRYLKGTCIRNAANITAPVLLLHGKADSDTPWEQSQELYDTLTALRKACQLLLFDGGDHGFDLNWPAANAFTPNGMTAWDTTLSFLHRVLNVSAGVSGRPGGVPATYSLSQNYPNPFNPSTTIRYGLPQRADVSLVVFNTLGQQVARLVDGNQDAGYHEVRFDASGLSSGVYFYRLQAGTYVEARKLLLLR